MCVSSYKIANCAFKKKKGMEQVQMVVIPWHTLERFMNAEKKIAKSMYWYMWHDYGDQLIN